jgi:hypothetical protein
METHCKKNLLRELDEKETQSEGQSLGGRTFHALFSTSWKQAEPTTIHKHWHWQSRRLIGFLSAPGKYFTGAGA